MRNLENKLLEILNPNEQMFGRGTFYQSFPDLKIQGQRSSSKRFKVYKLDKLLNDKSKVLDIGCNCGFFSLITAKNSQIVHSVEPNKTLIKIANLVKDHLKIKNCVFFNSTFDDFNTNEKFNLIFSFAVHHWVKCSFFKYIKRLSALLEPDGIIIFESHALNSIDKFFLKRIEIFKDLGFELKEINEIQEEKDMKRLFGVLVKKENFVDVSRFNKLYAFINCYWIILLNFFLNKRNYFIYLLKRFIALISKLTGRNGKN